ARIHAANLVNFGILPLEFAEAAAYERVEPGEELVIEDVGRQLRSGREVVARNRGRGEALVLRHSLSARQIEVLLAGGLLDYARGPCQRGGPLSTRQAP
ncbi:MAG: hypothetical protein QME93_09570, partial [Bacillota bacterium]|nr:hypothetical protein [Bacillota bacterium]